MNEFRGFYCSSQYFKLFEIWDTWESVYSLLKQVRAIVLILGSLLETTNWVKSMLISLLLC